MIVQFTMLAQKGFADLPVAFTVPAIRKIYPRRVRRIDENGYHVSVGGEEGHIIDGCWIVTVNGDEGVTGVQESYDVVVAAIRAAWATPANSAHQTLTLP